MFDHYNVLYRKYSEIAKNDVFLEIVAIIPLEFKKLHIGETSHAY